MKFILILILILCSCKNQVENNMTKLVKDSTQVFNIDSVDLDTILPSEPIDLDTISVVDSDLNETNDLED